MTDLESSMLELARQFALTNEEFAQRVYSSFDLGMKIPPSTHVRVTVELLHEANDITPVLEMEAV